MESKLDERALHANNNVQMREYWKDRFHGFAFNTYFQDSRVPGTGNTGERALFDLILPAALSGRLAEVAVTHKARHILLMAALGILAQKYSGLTDVCIFTPAYHKDGVRAPDADLLPVRMTGFMKLSFAGFMSVLANNIIRDARYAKCPLGKKLIATSTTPEQIAAIGLVVEELQQLPSEDLPDFDLLFSFSLEEPVKLSVSYKTIKFDSDFIERLARLYAGTLRLLLDNSNKLIEELEIIPAEEKEIIIGTFNNTYKEFPAGATVLDFFMRQAETNRDQPAIRFRDEQLTYGGLNERSNQVAGYLLSNFDCRQRVVAVFMDRSIDLMIALFGILKAGAIYLPLSKNYPEDRINYMLKDSCAQVIFTGKENCDRFPGFTCVDVAMSKNAPTDDINKAEPGSMAYIIYTSGSTGKPKGVLIRHLSVVNRLHWMQDKYPLQYTDVILQKTPLVFDVSIWELFWWSMVGASLVLAEPGAEKDPEQLCRAIEKENITVLHFVPSMLNTLLVYLGEYGNIHSLNSIRHLFASGEELRPADAKKFLDYCPAARLHNLYGPTEATVDVSYHEVSPSVNYHTIPIGKPIDNTVLYIFNKERQLQPIGCPGELYIGGVGLAAGYLNQCALTREKFVLNPLDNESTLYRTGDLARWLPDGNIEFLGRMDNQVKIRGNRIETGEIEHAINSFYAVNNAVVLAKETNHGTQLAGYLVVTPDFSEEALLAHLAARLPDYMIPSYFILLEEMPVTVNGKADKARLLTLKKTVNKPYSAPETELETKLAGIWGDILDLAPVSIDDNFFHIGGDSILAVKLIGMMNYELEVKISLPELYENKTIRKLAAFIGESGEPGSAEQVQQIEADLERFQQNFLLFHPDGQIEAVYPMSDTEKSMCFSHTTRPEEILYFKQIMQPVTYENFNVGLLRQALELLVKKHAAFRTGFDPNAQAHIIYRDIKMNFDHLDLSHLDHETQKDMIRNYLEQSRRSPIGPGKAPLWRFIVYKLGQDHHELLFEHHAAMLDGWSMNAFLPELNEVYVKLCRNRAVQLEPLSAGYRDYITQELLHNQDEEVRSYWRGELKGYKKFKLNEDTGPRVHHSIRQRSSKELVAILEQTARERGTSVKNILFAAYIYALRVLSGESDILVGLLSFNRPLKKDGDKILGCFTNAIPVRVRVPEGITWREFQSLIDNKLQEVKRYDSISLPEINRAVTGSSLSETNFFDTMFNFVRWHLLEKMQLEPMNDTGIDRLNFDTFVRRSTSFDVNYNVNGERILNMHEYSTPFMNDVTFEKYTLVFDEIIQNIIQAPDEIIGFTNK